jgi:hypothetical protein
VLGDRRDDVAPGGAALHAGAAGDGVDGDRSHALGPHDHRVLQRAGERGGVVAGALRRDAQAALACQAQGGDDVVGGLGQRDPGGPLVDREVPGPSGRVVVGMVRRDDMAGSQRRVVHGSSS